MQNSSTVYHYSLSKRLIPGVAIVTMVMMPLWGSSSWARDKPAPVVEAAGSVDTSLESRLARLERLLDNQTLVELATRLERLQNEVQQMLGQLEEQNHNLESLKKRQRDIYLDIDQRLRKLEEAKAASAPQPAMGAFVPAPGVPSTTMTPPSGSVSTTTPPPTAAVSAENPQEERIAYERAFNFLKDGRYDLAVAAFKTFVQTYPSGAYADNAQYWLGEANYVQRNFKAALTEFEKVVNNFPSSPKRADAMLKMGYTYQELGDINKARMALNNVVLNYPNTTAASLAKKRIQDLRQVQ